MAKVALLVEVKAKPGKEAEVEAFLKKRGHAGKWRAWNADVVRGERRK